MNNKFVNKFCITKYVASILLFTATVFSTLTAQEAPSWVDFCTKMKNGNLQNSTLLDYSYAGYHFSEKTIPDVSTWNKISVTDHGATPNDQTFDDAGIQAAIDAAEATGVPTVVFFPAGRYKISSETTYDTPIRVSKSYIVLKGAGSGIGGTEIYADKMGDATKKYNTPWKIYFKPESTSSPKLTNISKRINRGAKQITVDDASKLKVGMVVSLNHESLDNLEANMPGLKYNPVWYIGDRGMRMREKHLITAIDGKLVTFKNRLNSTIMADKSSAQLTVFPAIEEVGVEDILFTSGWKQYPEEYVHHANDIVDYAWRSLRMDYVRNGWVQNVEFRDWNEAFYLGTCMTMTIRNMNFTGKQGHTSYQLTTSTGILVHDCKDLVPTGFNGAGGQGHGPGLQQYSTGCVYLNCQMQKHQSIDCHGYHPYGNLLDNVYGGCFRGNGGAENSYPNSGPDFVFWNFVHASDFTSIEFDFWDLNKRRLHNYAKPKFVGFTSPGENISFKNEGLDELHGKQVYPKSLFDAQLQMRLHNAYASASSEKKGCLAVNTIDDQTDNYWSPEATAVGSYLMLDLGTDKTINTLLFKEKETAITKFKVECLQAGKWVMVNPVLSNKDDSKWIFKELTTRRIKISIQEINEGAEVKVTAFKTLLNPNAFPPTAEIKFTTTDTTLDEEYHLELEAILVNNDLDLKKIDLYIDNKLVRTANNTPFKWGHTASPDPNELDNLPKGTYTITAKSTDVFDRESEVQMNLTIKKKNIDTAISQINSSNIPFSISPNPNNGSFTIQMKNKETGTYTLYNLCGQMHSSGLVLNKKEIQLKSISPGLYIINIETKNGCSKTKILIQ